MSPQTSKTTTDLEPRRRHIIDQVAALGPALPGSLVQRRSRCGNAGCHCRADPPRLHGPYWVWTRSVNGKTVTRSLSDDRLSATSPGSTTPSAFANCSTSSNSSEWNRPGPRIPRFRTDPESRAYWRAL